MARASVFHRKNGYMVMAGNKKKLAVFVSGTGTNCENIIRYFRGSERGEVALVLSTTTGCLALEKAQRLGVPTMFMSREDFRSGNRLLPVMDSFKIDFIVLAGFLQLVPDFLLGRFDHAIINIHPALLPKFGGKGMYGMHVHEAVIAAGDRETGITIHYINSRYDEGRIIFQARCPVLPGDGALEVATRVHALEYAYYPQVIEHVVCGTPLPWQG